jgi:hypothetical protein
VFEDNLNVRLWPTCNTNVEVGKMKPYKILHELEDFFSR